MSYLSPLPLEEMPDLAKLTAQFQRSLGFFPNSMRILARRPKMVQGFAALHQAVMDPSGTVPIGLKRLISHVVSRSSGCRYCMAHTIHGAAHSGVEDAKLDALWNYSSSPLFNEAERAALDVAVAAGAVPNAVDEKLFLRLRQHWDEGQIVEIVAVIAMFGFLNRWNDTMATPLEPAPISSAEKRLKAQGWNIGKHGRAE